MLCTALVYIRRLDRFDFARGLLRPRLQHLKKRVNFIRVSNISAHGSCTTHVTEPTYTIQGRKHASDSSLQTVFCMGRNSGVTAVSGKAYSEFTARLNFLFLF